MASSSRTMAARMYSSMRQPLSGLACGAWLKARRSLTRWNPTAVPARSLQPTYKRLDGACHSVSSVLALQAAPDGAAYCLDWPCLKVQVLEFHFTEVPMPPKMALRLAFPLWLE